jgi:hypothetical protein
MEVTGFVLGAFVRVVMKLAPPPSVEDAIFARVERPGHLRPAFADQVHHGRAGTVEPLQEPQELVVISAGAAQRRASRARSARNCSAHSSRAL